MWRTEERTARLYSMKLLHISPSPTQRCHYIQQTKPQEPYKLFTEKRQSNLVQQLGVRLAERGPVTGISLTENAGRPDHQHFATKQEGVVLFGFYPCTIMGDEDSSRCYAFTGMQGDDSLDLALVSSLKDYIFR